MDNIKVNKMDNKTTVMVYLLLFAVIACVAIG